MHRLGQILHIAGVDRGHRGARRAQNVHVELRAQTIDLLGGESGVGEHSALLGDVRPVARGAGLLQVLHQQGTHVLDSLRHRGALLLPLRLQHRVVQDRRDDARSVQRRARPQRARADLQLLNRVLALLRVGGHHRHDTRTLAVQAEVLRERQRQRHVVAVLHELAEAVGVVRHVARAVAQIGRVEQHHVVLLLAQRAQLVPLLVRRVHAGRVVRAGVEHEAGVVRSLVHVVQHALEVQGGRLAVQVGVVTGGQSSVAENGVLVGPGRVGEQNVARNIAVLQELREKTKRARARDCLGVGNHVLLLVVDLVTPCELASGVVEIGNTDQGRVLVVLRAAESLLGLTDARKHVGLPLHPHTNPNLSMLIAVGTHSQNDLSGIFISIILLLKEKDGIRLGTRYLSIRF